MHESKEPVRNTDMLICCVAYFLTARARISHMMEKLSMLSIHAAFASKVTFAQVLYSTMACSLRAAKEFSLILMQSPLAYFTPTSPISPVQRHSAQLCCSLENAERLCFNAEGDSDITVITMTHPTPHFAPLHSTIT